MVEGKGLAFPMPLQHQLCQFFVLCQHNRQVFLGESRGAAGVTDHRLHAQFGEAKAQHFTDVFQKIGVCMGESSAHIVILVVAGLYQLLELGHDALPTAVAGIVYAVAVVDFLAAVQT